MTGDRPLPIAWLFAVWSFAATLGAQEVRPPLVFDLPRLQVEQAIAHRQIAQLIEQKNWPAAEAKVQEAIERVPHDAKAYGQLARIQVRQGRGEEALASLKRAVELGLPDKKLLLSEELAPLREAPQFAEIEKQAALPRPAPIGWQYRIQPALVVDGEAMVGEGNTVWNPRLGAFQVFFKFETPAADAPIDDIKEAPLITTGAGKAGDLLRAWRNEGTAAGNRGDLYDNHDGGHSKFKIESYPQFTKIAFSQEVVDRKLHRGLQNMFLYNGVTIGNSSTALTGGAQWRSLPRLGMTQPPTPSIWHVQYLSNHLYVYPEHRDHDPIKEGARNEGRGDLFPANTPYVLISQGSSGSDQPILKAVASTLAAFRPEVKARLIKERLLMPTVQMILRTCYAPVSSPEAYLTGVAHPTVFDGKKLGVVKMVSMAHDIRIGSLPPLAQIEVLEENLGEPGRDYFDASPREKLFDTPCAIARYVKSSAHDRRLVVSAEQSKDVQGKPLTFHFVLLRGDPDKVSIKTLNEQGSRAEIVVGYHQRRPVVPGAALTSRRVDIGVFVHNGDYYSPPAFLSLSYPDNETRVYDDRRRILSVDYTDPETKDNYFDPLLDARRDWRDDYHYAPTGELLGWTRTREVQKQEFTAQGELILSKDDQGRPKETQKVTYVLVAEPKSKGRFLISQQPAPREGN